MSGRFVRLVILCEDSQHESFIRRLLCRIGWEARDLRIEKLPAGRGSGEQWVKTRFPKELSSCRRKIAQGNRVGLVTMIDADTHECATRITELEEKCLAEGVDFLKQEDPVVIAVPRRNIETWIEHLSSGKPVDETIKYHKLPEERRCQVAVDNLVKRCRSSKHAVNTSPPSLLNACHEFKRIRSHCCII